MARIIVIDDEAGFREFVRVTLEEQGHQVEEAKDGIEALAICEREPVDLALVDLIMPRKDGVKTIEELRTAHGRTSIIVVTGAAPGRWPLRMLYDRPGSVHMLVKPVTAEMLIETVSEALAEGATSA